MSPVRSHRIRLAVRYRRIDISVGFAADRNDKGDRNICVDFILCEDKMSFEFISFQ